MNNENNYHKIFGEHSNIPKCCIRFFINEFDRMNVDEMENYIRKQHIAEIKLGKRFGYRACPSCIKNLRWTEIHICNNKCKEFIEKLAHNHDHKSLIGFYKNED